MNVKSNSGFSLVELMVVVAIIGVLATVAVPNYMKFQAKAKQSNAKAELSGVYTANKSFFVEYTQYSSHLPLIGFIPEGQNQCVAPPAGTNRVYNTGIAIASAGAPTGATYPCGVAGPANGTQWFGCQGQGCNGVVAAAPAGGVLTMPAGAVAAAFTASATATLRSGLVDTWTMTQDNALTNTVSGI